MHTTLLFPTSMEAAALRQLRPDLDIRECGVGVVETARYVARLLREEHPSRIVLCGIAGAYDDTPIGKVVQVVVERMAGTPAQYAREYRTTLRFEGLAEVAGNTVARVNEPAEGATIENMEGAMLFALCEDAGIECAEIRSISNRVGAPYGEWDIPRAIESLTATLSKLF